MEIICNVSTIPLSKYSILINLIVINVILGKILYIRWMKFKLIYSDIDNIFNTGHFKWALIEIFFMLIMPYPCVHNHLYEEESNDFVVGNKFQWNDFLLCFMIFFRLIYVIRTILSLSAYTDPRS